MKKRLTYLLLCLSTILSVAYFAINLINISDEIEQIFKIISTLLLTFFTISFALYNIANLKREKGRVLPINITNLTLVLFIAFNLVHDTGLIILPAQKTVQNFANNSVAEVLKWASGNEIEIEQLYEASDTIPIYHIISQDVESGTLLKDVKKLRVIISSGPDYNKTVVVPNMKGSNAEDVLSFIEENLLNNVDVEFIINDAPRHTVIEQSYSGDMRRNDKLSLVLSLGTAEQQTPYIMEDLTNKSLFEAIFTLKMNGLKYTTNAEFSDAIQREYVLGQSITKGEEVNSKTIINLVVSKGKSIKVPNILNMKIEDVTKWIMENRLAVKFEDRYDDQIEMGKIIECNLKEGDKIEEGTEVVITSSKGQLKMKEFQTLDEYKEWFEKYGIKYEIKYETNETVVENSIIRASHAKDEIIKNSDTVIVYASKGGLISVPNFKNLSKSAALSKCNSLGLLCSYVNGSYNNSLTKGTVTNQSVASGQKVEKGTSVKLTLSLGPATYMPNFVGKSRSTIQSECNSKNLVCSFVTGGYNSSVSKDVAVNQSIASGKQVYSGTKVTITLSLGPAKSFPIQLQSVWFQTGSSTETANFLYNYFKNNAPGVNLTVRKYVDVDTSGDSPGSYISSCSTIGFSATVVQGQSYTICIRQ